MAAYAWFLASRSNVTATPRTLATTLLVLAATACGDGPPAPSLVPPSSVARGTVLGTANVPVDPATGAGSATLPTLSAPTWVEIKREGGIHMLDGQGQPAITLGPLGKFWSSGYTFGCVLQLQVRYSIRGATTWTSCPDNGPMSVVDTILAEGTGIAERSARPGGVSYTYAGTSGPQTVTVTKIGPYRPVVTASRSVAYPWEQVTFTVTTTPVVANQFFRVMYWRYQADSAQHSYGPQNANSVSWTGSFLRTGTVWVVGDFNGVIDSASAPLTIREPGEMEIVVSPGTTFSTPTWATFRLRFRTPGDSAIWWSRMSVQRWVWTPESGNVWVGGTGNTERQGTVGEPAWFRAEVDVSGFTRKPRVRVRVVQCPQGDSLLDEPSFRRMLKAIRDSSMSPLHDPGKRREWGGEFVEDTGTYTRRGIVDTSASHPNRDACSYLNRTERPGSRILALSHGHPWTFQDSIPPSLCPRTNPSGGGFGRPPGPIPRGASREDRRREADDGVSTYVVDSYGVDRIDRNGRQLNQRFFPRYDAQNRCTLF